MLTNYGGEDGNESIGEQDGARMPGGGPVFELERGSPFDAPRLEEVAEVREARCVTEIHRDANPSVSQRLALLLGFSPSSLPRIR